MSDLIVVDTDRVNNLSREFCTQSAELNDRIARFRAETAPGRGSYGNTSDATTAESEYVRTLQQALREIDRLQHDFQEVAVLLADQAGAWTENEQGAAFLASSVHGTRP
ncbi:hypothetical protein [Lentzea sp. NPDC059081]|uniref:hypothetical protein n=1 Tax=Lentzea sp. NPDC059081 TaxID=3346719 RepID=UPI003693E731